MRRALIYTAFILSWLCAAAQSRDVVDTSAATYDTVQYFAPKVNPIRYFGSPFCNHFAEIRLFTGLYDAGVGLDYTYLPEIWGFNLAGNVGYANLWLSGGYTEMPVSVVRTALSATSGPRLRPASAGHRPKA